MIFNALITGLNAIDNGDYLNYSTAEYNQIPENQKDYVDILIKNIDIKTDAGLFKNQELSVLYHEEKKGESVFFKPVCHRFSEQTELLAHRVFNADQILRFLWLNLKEKLLIFSKKVILGIKIVAKHIFS